MRRVEITKDYLFGRSIPEPNSGCWLWLGRCDGKGYGRFNNTMVHRLSYLAARGPISAGLLVLHKCDVPGCINPDHLFLGTALDNARDRDRKGRGGHGQPKPGLRKPADRAGITFSARYSRKPWSVRLWRDNATIYIGSFPTEAEARAARVEAVARLGIPTQGSI